MRRLLFSALFVLASITAKAAELKPIVLDPSYQHDKWNTEPDNIIREFRAYTVSFDDADDDNGDDVPDVWGIPQWVSYEIKRFNGTLGPAPKRPDWMTEKVLHEVKIAPSDDTYHFSLDWRDQNPNSKFLGYDRGHMCMKQIAFRLGADADWNTHTVLNACPQRAELNQGIWLDLENKTQQWADKYERIWVICGPIIYGRQARNWLGQRELGEVMIAIPDAFFKIVIREAQGKPVVMAFVYPQHGLNYRGNNPDHRPYLTNIRAIEHFTGLNFMADLQGDDHDLVERTSAIDLWPTE